MDLVSVMPEWLVWCAVGAASVFALAVFVNIIENALDLETS